MANAKRIANTIKRVNVVERKHLGSYAEMLAAAWLLERGYEVFRNVSDRGPIDLVVVKDGQTTFVDVKLVKPVMLVSREKAGQARIRSEPQMKPLQKEMGVVPLFVGPDGFCSFDLDRVREVYNEIYLTHMGKKT